jgi:hypothetical protein
MYSSVPTNEFVRKVAVHDFVSMTAFCELEEEGLRLENALEMALAKPEGEARTMVGVPGLVVGLERSKSVSMMWPVWWRRMSRI